MISKASEKKRGRQFRIAVKETAKSIRMLHDLEQNGFYPIKGKVLDFLVALPWGVFALVCAETDREKIAKLRSRAHSGDRAGEDVIRKALRYVEQAPIRAFLNAANPETATDRPISDWLGAFVSDAVLGDDPVLRGALRHIRRAINSIGYRETSNEMFINGDDILRAQAGLSRNKYLEDALRRRLVVGMESTGEGSGKDLSPAERRRKAASRQSVADKIVAVVCQRRDCPIGERVATMTSIGGMVGLLAVAPVARDLMESNEIPADAVRIIQQMLVFTALPTTVEMFDGNQISQVEHSIYGPVSNLYFNRFQTYQIFVDMFWGAICDVGSGLEQRRTQLLLEDGYRLAADHSSDGNPCCDVSLAALIAIDSESGAPKHLSLALSPITIQGALIQSGLCREIEDLPRLVLDAAVSAEHGDCYELADALLSIYVYQCVLTRQQLADEFWTVRRRVGCTLTFLPSVAAKLIALGENLPGDLLDQLKSLVPNESAVDGRDRSEVLNAMGRQTVVLRCRGDVLRLKSPFRDRLFQWGTKVWQQTSPESTGDWSPYNYAGLLIELAGIFENFLRSRFERLSSDALKELDLRKSRLTLGDFCVAYEREVPRTSHCFAEIRNAFSGYPFESVALRKLSDLRNRAAHGPVDKRAFVEFCDALLGVRAVEGGAPVKGVFMAML